MTDHLLSLGVSSVAERRVDCGTVEVSYWVHGEGIPLVMLLGLGAPAESWGPLPALLAQGGYKAVAIDNRDAGRSSDCRDAYEIKDMAGDVVSVMDDAGIGSAYVLGLSMGGMIAQELALSHPHRIAKLMLVATGPGPAGGGGVSPDPSVLETIFTSFNDPDPARGVRATVAMETAPGFVETHPEVVDRIVAGWSQGRSNWRRFSRQWEAILKFSSWERLETITCPTLVVHGDVDPLVPVANGKNLASRIPGARMEVLANTGHLVPLERPFEFVHLITTFFPTDVSDRETVGGTP